MNSAENTIEKELSEKGSYATCAVGSSMLPMLRGGSDMIIVEPPRGELSKYDVVLYKDAASRYILHRIVKVKHGEYIIRGDNTYVNERVPKDAVIGVLTVFNKDGKRHEVTDFGYRLYARRRVFLYPARKAYRRVRSFFASLFRKIFKSVN